MPLPTAVRVKADRARALIEEGKAPAPAAGTPAPTPAAPAGGETIESLKEQLAKAQQAQRVLQGKYNAELPQAKADLDAAKKRVEELEGQLKKKHEAGTVESLTEDDRRLLGEDLIPVYSKLVREVAAQVAAEAVAPLTKRVDEFARMSEAQYAITIDELIPDFDVVNEDPAFMAWLQKTDPATGKLRDDLLQRAHAARQGFRLAEIFNAYKEKREIGARTTAQPAPRSPSPGPESGQPPEPLPEQGRIFTRAEVAQFYADKRTGKYKGREEEARKTEAEILLASREGRVR